MLVVRLQFGDSHEDQVLAVTKGLTDMLQRRRGVGSV